MSKKDKSEAEKVERVRLDNLRRIEEWERTTPEREKAKAEAEAERTATRKSQIRAAIETTEQRDAAPYDALEGSPPEWMPKADIPEWREARRFMLDKHLKKDVQAWINGKPEPPMPEADHFGEFAQNLLVLRAAAYSTLKEAQRAQMLRAQRVRAERISEGYENRLRLFRAKLAAWEQSDPSGNLARRRAFSGNAIALKFAPRPELFRDVTLLPAADNLPLMAEETIADYVDEIRKRDREGFNWG